MLTGLAMQHAEDYLSGSAKQSYLQKPAANKTPPPLEAFANTPHQAADTLPNIQLASLLRE